jgi:hypothetical protein
MPASNRRRWRGLRPARSNPVPPAGGGQLDPVTADVIHHPCRRVARTGGALAEVLPAPDRPAGHHNWRRRRMRGIFRGLLAGWGASKLGGGCISTIIIFLILWWLLRGVGI